MAPGERLRLGVIGTGAMGRHHVRLAAAAEDVELVGIHDRRASVAAKLSAAHGAPVAADLDRLAGEIDAAILAVPTVDHAELACSLLARGVHVMVEKPIASTLEEADRMVAAAATAGRVLAVGHVEFFNPGVQAVLGVGGAVRFVEIQRLSPFTPRSLDIDVILDLMIHDIQILHALDPSPVAEIRASGIDVMSSRVDMTHARIALESGAVAILSASRVSAEPVRKLRVYRRDIYLSLDYRDQELKGYGLREHDGERQIVPLDLDVQRREPLRAELEAFVAACRGQPTRYVDGRAGRRALETALAVRDAVARPG